MSGIRWFGRRRACVRIAGLKVRRLARLVGSFQRSTRALSRQSRVNRFFPQARALEPRPGPTYYVSALLPRTEHGFLPLDGQNLRVIGARRSYRLSDGVYRIGTHRARAAIGDRRANFATDDFSELASPPFNCPDGRALVSTQANPRSLQSQRGFSIGVATPNNGS